MMLVGPASIDDVNLTGSECRFIRCQVQGQRRYFLRLTKPPHGLPLHEAAPGSIRIAAESCHALIQRWCLDGSRTNRVTPDTARNEIGGNRFREPNHRRLGCAIYKALRHALDAGGDRSHVDDAAAASIDHARQYGFAQMEHGLDVDLKGAPPIGIGALQNAPLVYVTRTIEQHIERTYRRDALIDCGGNGDIQDSHLE